MRACAPWERTVFVVEQHLDVAAFARGEHVAQIDGAPLAQFADAVLTFGKGLPTDYNDRTYRLHLSPPENRIVHVNGYGALPPWPSWSLATGCARQLKPFAPDVSHLLRKQEDIHAPRMEIPRVC